MYRLWKTTKIQLSIRTYQIKPQKCYPLNHHLSQEGDKGTMEPAEKIFL
jgi:hypothetical protein